MRRGGNRRRRADDLFYWDGPRRRAANPLIALWRWRYEIVIGIGVPLGLNALAAATHPVAAVCVAASAVLAYVRWRSVRRVVAARCLALLTPHRLRVGMIASGLVSPKGWLPAVLWTSPRPTGTLVTLGCPAGIDIEAFVAARSELTAACWASDVQVARHPRYANIVVVLVVTTLLP